MEACLIESPKVPAPCVMPKEREMRGGEGRGGGGGGIRVLRRVCFC